MWCLVSAFRLRRREEEFYLEDKLDLRLNQSSYRWEMSLGEKLDLHPNQKLFQIEKIGFHSSQITFNSVKSHKGILWLSLSQIFYKKEKIGFHSSLTTLNLMKSLNGRLCLLLNQTTYNMSKNLEEWSDLRLSQKFCKVESSLKEMLS